MNAGLKPVLARLARGETLGHAEAEAAFGVVMDGLATPAQIGAECGLYIRRLRGRLPQDDRKKKGQPDHPHCSRV